MFVRGMSRAFFSSAGEASTAAKALVDRSAIARGSDSVNRRDGLEDWDFGPVVAG